MLQVSYVSSPKNACALACYTMIAQYFFPEKTFDDIAKIVDWEEGYVVWGFKFWIWIIEKGIDVYDYDSIDYGVWSKEGIAGLEKSMGKKAFTYVQTHTKDLNALTIDIQRLFKKEKFYYKKQKPTMDMLVKEIRANNLCEVVLDSHYLDKIEGFALHRVVVLDADDKYVIFHDPRKDPSPYRKETIDNFKSAWLMVNKNPELCVYKKT